MGENGNGSRIVSLDQASRNAKDAHGRSLRHNATVKDVYQIVAEETAKVHEYYLNQIPAFTARMIQDALMSYGLIKLTDEATLAASADVGNEPQPPAPEAPPADADQPSANRTEPAA